MFRAYQNPRLTLADHAYLLGMHPLDLWCAGEFRKNAKLSWKELYAKSGPARQIGSAWLLNSRNQRAQNNRLRIRIEKDAFARMTPYWQRLGFPFKTLVPTYATAIGSSSDRPTALAELVGILVNDGMRRPATTLTRIHFADATPYETVLERPLKTGEQVLAPEVARTMRKAMAEVVEQGTARRLNGAFKLADGSVLTVGGKTGSGDNRFETFNRSGGVVSSRATNRTATFVFYHRRALLRRHHRLRPGTRGRPIIILPARCRSLCSKCSPPRSRRNSITRNSTKYRRRWREDPRRASHVLSQPALRQRRKVRARIRQ